MQACRLIEKKGVATSLRAFAVFKKDHPNAEFIIAGKGPLQPELQMLAAGLGISRDVHFVGFVSTEKLNELYASAHLFVHPSETPPDENQEVAAHYELSLLVGRCQVCYDCGLFESTAKS